VRGGDGGKKEKKREYMEKLLHRELSDVTSKLSSYDTIGLMSIRASLLASLALEATWQNTCAYLRLLSSSPSDIRATPNRRSV
jgi:hypothetical protein